MGARFSVKSIIASVCLAIGCVHAQEKTISDYILQPSDIIKVQVFQEPDLDREVRISQEYSITLPLIGLVDLKGRSVSAAERLITELYNRDYLVNPQISVIVLQYSTRTVNVIGSVNTPGVVSFTPEQAMTLVDAISKAGGPSRLADRRRVDVIRKMSDGTSQTITLSIEDTKDQSFQLQENDVITVRERIL